MAAARTMAEGFGYTPFGASETGKLEEGKEAKLSLKLNAGCYQIFVFPDDGLKGVDLTMQDPAGKGVGTAAKQDGQSTIKHCVTETGSYTLVLKSAGGSGTYIAQPYASNQPVPVGDNPKDPDNPVPCNPGDPCEDDPGVNSGTDDCGSGVDLTIGGTTKSTTAGKGGNVHWSCAASEGPAAIYRVHVEGRHKLVIDMSAKFDAVMALYRAAPSDGYLCDTVNELECSDDSEGMTSKGHIDAIVDTGDYGIVIGGYDGERGEFEIKTRLDEAPSLDTVCSAARTITPGVKQSDVVGGSGSSFHATCAASDGDEVLYKLELKSKSRLRLSSKSTSGDVILSMRGQCQDPATETVCTNRWHVDGVSWSGLMAAGNYTLIADTSDPNHSGTLDTTVETAPESGSGTAEADSCKDAKPLPTGTMFTADTFQAKGDLKATCAADSGPDVVYKLEIKSKTRVFLSSNEDEGRHIIAIQKTCGETKGELACDLLTSNKVDASLDPGNYFVVVKGKGSEDFGRAKINVKLRDLGPAVAACKAAPKLVAGTAVNDTTSGQPDKFASPGCGGAISYQSSGDKVYQFTIKERSHVNLAFKGNPFYNAILSLRSDCSDSTKSEIVCSSYYAKVIDRDLDAGTYYVVVDGYGAKSEGAYTLEMTTKAIK